LDTKSELAREDCNFLAFLLDNLLASSQTYGDKDCPALSRLLIVALASCNHCLDSQNALVQEVKLALNRAVHLPESNDKHIKIQALANIINSMIETCPPIQNASQQNNFRNNPHNSNLVNNIMKIMHKKSLINDLAHVSHHVDLSCGKCIETLNTLLKPLETMSKTLNMNTRKRNDLIGSATKNVTPSTVATTTTTTTVPSNTAAIAAAPSTSVASTVRSTAPSGQSRSSTNRTLNRSGNSTSESGTTSTAARRSDRRSGGGNTSSNNGNNNTSSTVTSTTAPTTTTTTTSSPIQPITMSRQSSTIAESTSRTDGPSDIQHSGATSDIADLNINTSLTSESTSTTTTTKPNRIK
jgi:ribosomal protein S8